MTSEFIEDVNKYIERLFKSGDMPHELNVLDRHYPVPVISKENEHKLEALIDSTFKRYGKNSYYEAYYERGLSCAAIAAEQKITPGLASSCVQDFVQMIARDWIAEHLNELKKQPPKILNQG